MVDDYTTEEEQVERIKKWFKENGSSLLTGLFLGLAVLFGGKAWLEWQRGKADQASDLYAQMMLGMSQNQLEVARAQADTLITTYSSSPYAILAAFALASSQLQAGENAAARAQLEWAYEKAAGTDLENSARLRLARVRLGEGEPDAAAALLAGAGDPAFASAYAELRGDIALARGDRSLAFAEYRTAIELSSDPNARVLLEAKRDDAAPLDAGANP